MYDGTNFVTLGGSEFLSKTGNQKLTGNFTVDGNETVTGNELIGGTLGVTGLTTLNAAVGLTRTAGDNTVNLATTEFATTSTANEAAIRLAADNLLAPLASPALTGTPTSPTASTGTSTNQIATCAFVTATAFNAALPAQAGNAGKFVTTDGTNASWAELVIPSYLLMAQGII
jgi:hypothetical protein